MIVSVDECAGMDKAVCQAGMATDPLPNFSKYHTQRVVVAVKRRWKGGE